MLYSSVGIQLKRKQLARQRLWVIAEIILFLLQDEGRQDEILCILNVIYRFSELNADCNEYPIEQRYGTCLFSTFFIWRCLAFYEPNLTRVSGPDLHVLSKIPSIILEKIENALNHWD